MIDKDSKLVANYLRQAFAGTPEVQRYFAKDNVRYVDIIKTPHPDQITYVGTIGGFRRPMKGATPDSLEIRVEVLSAVKNSYVEIMAQTLGFLILSLDTDKIIYRPGMVVENAIPENRSSNMRHIYLCDPFLWENGLKSMCFDNFALAFLYAMPITDKEKEIFDKNGADALESFLQKNNVPYFDMNR